MHYNVHNTFHSEYFRRVRQMTEKHRQILANKLVQAYGATWEQRSNVEKETEKFTEIVLECCQDESLVRDVTIAL